MALVMVADYIDKTVLCLFLNLLIPHICEQGERN